MHKIFLLLVFCFNLSFSYFVVEDNYIRQVEVLKNLDINVNFLQDSVFLSMKEDMGFYRQKQFLRTLEKGSNLIPVLRDMIREAGIPPVFLYMAMAESGFSTKAYSKAKASGVWQFISGTAKKYDLTIDDYVDERRDPVKSTQAAIRYLNDLHGKFGKWYLAVMAYNCGEGRVTSAISKAGTDDLSVLLDEDEKYLPLETRRYVRKVITMAYLAEDTNFLVGNGADHFLNSGDVSGAFVKKEVNGGLSLSDVAEAIGMSLSDVWSYNPHLNYFFTPPNKKTYHIYIPYNKEQQYTSNFNPSKTSSKFDVYIVTSGDTFFKIAKKYKMDYKIIKDFNKITSNNLKLGQKLIIPILNSTQTKYVAQNVNTPDSKKYKLNVAQLEQTNSLQTMR